RSPRRSAPRQVGGRISPASPPTRLACGSPISYSAVADRATAVGGAQKPSTMVTNQRDPVSPVLHRPEQGEPDHFGYGGHTEFRLQPTAVGLDRLATEVQPLRDLPDIETKPDQPEHLQLTVRELVDRVRTDSLRDPAGCLSENHLGHLRTQIDPARQHVPDRRDDLFRRLFLLDVPRGPGPQGSLGV